MFGLNAFFAALNRLTVSINRSADLFDAANLRLAEQLGFDRPADVPALAHNAEEDIPTGNGKRKAKANA
jgi:hypothetical protein